MNKKIYGVYGASGFGREVFPLLRNCVSKSNIEKNTFYFVDDYSKNKRLNNYPLVSLSSFLDISADERYIAITIADSKVRQKLTEKCLENNIKQINIKANNVVILDDVRIDEGSILCSFVTLTSNIKVGKQFHANIYSYIGHDCIIGDYVTLAPSVKCNGNVIIEDHAYIGTGAIIKQGRPGKPIRIGKGATIGAGAFVTKNVPDNMTVFGNPAIEFTKENLRKRNG